MKSKKHQKTYLKLGAKSLSQICDILKSTVFQSISLFHVHSVYCLRLVDLSFTRCMIFVFYTPYISNHYWFNAFAHGFKTYLIDVYFYQNLIYFLIILRYKHYHKNESS